MPEIDLELSCVATADIEPVDVQERVRHLDGVEYPLTPAPVPDAAASTVPKLVLKRAAPLERHEGQFEVRGGQTVKKDCRTEPRAEREHQLKPFTRNHSESVHVGVVEKAGGFPEPVFELSRE